MHRGMLFFWKLAATWSMRSHNPDQDQVIPLPSVRLSQVDITIHNLHIKFITSSMQKVKCKPN